MTGNKLKFVGECHKNLWEKRENLKDSLKAYFSIFVLLNQLIHSARVPALILCGKFLKELMIKFTEIFFRVFGGSQKLKRHSK